MVEFISFIIACIVCFTVGYCLSDIRELKDELKKKEKWLPWPRKNRPPKGRRKVGSAKRKARRKHRLRNKWK